MHDSHINQGSVNIRVQELNQIQNDLKEEMDRCATIHHLSNDKIWPIYDGVYSSELYLTAKPRIMWVLKEPWDIVVNGKPKGGGWSIPEDCFDKDDAWANPTWQYIIYSLTCIFENKSYEDLPWLRDDHSLAKYLKRIAYINLSKMPALTSTNPSTLTGKYDIWREIDLKQIRLYSPEIVYFGKTFDLFKKDLGLSDSNIIKEYDGWQRVYLKDGVKYVDAYHPGNRFNEDDKAIYTEYLVDAAKI